MPTHRLTKFCFKRWYNHIIPIISCDGYNAPYNILFNSFSDLQANILSHVIFYSLIMGFPVALN